MTHPNTDQGVTAVLSQDIGEWATTIRVNLYRHASGMPSYPHGIVEPILEQFRLSSTAALEAEIASLRQRLESAEGVLRLFIGSAYPVAAEINPRGHNWSEAYLDQALAHARAFLQEQEKRNG